MNLNADNLNTRTNLDGEIVVEPSYIEYLRENGYAIEGVNESHCVPSGSREMGHVVMNITTYLHPKDSPLLDVAEHEIGLWVCDCWAFRNDSANVAGDAGITPDQSAPCSHIKHVSKVQRALEDESQEGLNSYE